MDKKRVMGTTVAALLLGLLLPACGGTQSSASEVLEPGTWTLAVREVDQDQDWNTVLTPVPALPDLAVRITGAAVGCHPGCSCTFGEVQDAVRYHDGLSPDEHYAWVSFEERCADGTTVVCDELEFTDNENANGTCGNMSRTDLATLWSTNPYAPHTNYAVTLRRASYE